MSRRNSYYIDPTTIELALQAACRVHNAAPGQPCGYTGRGGYCCEHRLASALELNLGPSEEGRPRPYDERAPAGVNGQPLVAA